MKTKKNASKLKNIEESARIYNSLEEVCSDPIVDLVYIGTPPFLHYSQSKIALYAGKHVICEKPAATKFVEAVELRTFAKENNLLYVVNLMQRCNPLYVIFSNLIQDKILGEFLHGFFENYASDEFLPKEHWFWDEEKIRGIFIEHGVHFFDMFQGWLGSGKLVNAIQSDRPNVDEKITDRIQATVSYKDSFVNFYHGFN